MPEVFAPGILSLPDTREHSLAYSPRGDEIFFARGEGWPYTRILRMKRSGDTWSVPEIAPFSKDAYATQPVFSPDGQYLYFSSSHNTEQLRHYTIWRCRRNGDSWSLPEEVVNMGGSDMHEYHPTVGPDGSLYFLYWDFKAQTGDIWVSRQSDGKHLPPTRLAAPISTEYNEVRPSVDPKGNYLLFESDRPGGFGGTDLYICWKNPDGNWSAPRNLGPEVNTSNDDDVPNISPDGKYWFFQLNGDVYWRDAKAALARVAPDATIARRGPYLGEKLPQKAPEIFAPGIVSRPGTSEMRIVFSPTGDECVFGRSAQGGGYPWKLYYSRVVDGAWTEPALAPFNPIGGKFTGQAFYSATSDKLYFTSDANGEADIWAVTRTAQGWGQPERLAKPVNSSGADVYYSRAPDGTEYFASDRTGTKGKLDVWRVPPGATEAVNLGAINSADYDYDPCVEPKRRYLLFVGPDGLSVVYPVGNGGWGRPILVSRFLPELKGVWADGESFSPDGKYLFWRQGGNWEKGDLYWAENPIPAEDPDAALAKAIGPYFGLKAPARVPELFAHDILTQAGGIVAVTRIAFSGDGRECFFSGPVDDSFSATRMFTTRCVGDRWTPPEQVAFMAGASCRQPFFSPDGITLYFSSSANGSSDVWQVQRTGDGWGQPQVLPAPVNTSGYDGMFTVLQDGTAFIESNRDGGLGGFDIWRYIPGTPAQAARVENLGSSVNSDANENDPFIAPDGSYILFGRGYGDVFVSFAKSDGTWGGPINMEKFVPGISTHEQEYAPVVSADGRYLFFNRVSGGGMFWVENPLASRAGRGTQ
jgi:Tol biopolymer transport system component